MTIDAVPATPWDPAPTLQAVEAIREHVLTDEDLTPDDRQKLLDQLDLIEREALHPERDPVRLRAHVDALGRRAEGSEEESLIEVLGPDRVAALTGLLPHV